MNKYSIKVHFIVQDSVFDGDIPGRREMDDILVREPLEKAGFKVEQINTTVYDQQDWIYEVSKK